MTNKSEKAVSAMSLPQYLKKFPNEKAAIDYFLDLRYKGNLTCPHCGAAASIYQYRERPKFFQCSNCHNTLSPFKDTIFAKPHIDLR
jgi:transposase-like protein